jgi:predicted house-cleaning noncanonical NTP pyrophosphatase (MazG superfamily)
MSTVHNKLVRDTIPEIIQKTGKRAITKVLADDEYRLALRQKLQEEVDEYLADENGEELADIVEVIYTLAASIQLTPDDIETIRTQKLAERGGFTKKIYLERVED